MDSAQHINTATRAAVVKPFFNYAALAFLVALVLLIIKSFSFPSHYFEPGLLTVTHIMALGWGTMIVMGSVYQLIPVLAEQALYSEKLAVASFVFTATGIPLLSYGFYTFNMGAIMQWGAILVNAGLLLFLWNVVATAGKKDFKEIHSSFIVSAVIWLQLTALIGLLLVFNFTHNIFTKDSLYYLSFHAHLGIAGWFLLLVTGVSSRLIPMFLISKYTNNNLLWQVFYLIQSALIIFIILFLCRVNNYFFYIPAALVIIALIRLGKFLKLSYQKRLRKRVDGPVRLSVTAIALMALPLLAILIILTGVLSDKNMATAIINYGFLIFFGWVTLIILGMTFKTLPFIIWNEQFRNYTGSRALPQPGDLYHKKLFNYMVWLYIPGFFMFSLGIVMHIKILLVTASCILLLSGCCYAVNILLMQRRR